MLASVKRSPTTCSFRPPVQGDDALAEPGRRRRRQRSSRTTPKAVRGQRRSSRSTVRAGGGGTGYSLRIFPQRKRYELDPRPGRRRLPARAGKSERDQEDQRAQPASRSSPPAPRSARSSTARRWRRSPTPTRVRSGAQGALRARLPGEEEEQEGRRDLQARRGLGPQPASAAQGLARSRPRRSSGLAARGPGSGLGGNWQGDRPKRRPQHLRPRRQDAGPGDPRRLARPGPPVRRPDPQHRPGDRLERPARARRALLGAAQRRGPDDGPAREPAERARSARALRG